MIVYADRNKLAEFVSVIPDNAETLLRYASLLVAGATRHDRYDVDPAGKPSDPFTIGAFEDATCLQAAEWATAGVDPVAAGAPSGQTVKSSSIAGGNVTFDVEGDTDRRTVSATTLCVAAVEALRQEGLCTGAVWT